MLKLSLKTFSPINDGFTLLQVNFPLLLSITQTLFHFSIFNLTKIQGQINGASWYNFKGLPHNRTISRVEHSFSLISSNSFSGIHVVGRGSWKKRKVGKFEVRKFPCKLESTIRSWKVSNAVLSNEKYFNFDSNFPTCFFPTSIRTFQLLVFTTFSFQLHISPFT